MTDMVAVDFNPRKSNQSNFRKSTIGTTDIVAVDFNPRKSNRSNF